METQSLDIPSNMGTERFANSAGEVREIKAPRSQVTECGDLSKHVI